MLIISLTLVGILIFLWLRKWKANTSKNNKLEWAVDKFWLILTGITIVGVAYLYFYLPQVFKWLAVDVWGVPTSSVGEDKALQLTDLGPLGDIYGSLNTLFTSATLAFVVYATLLQREANKDARDALADQLQHAKDSTEEQLKQARHATATQLVQARRSLKLQLEASRHDTFTNMFHSLLSHKIERFNQISMSTKDKTIGAYEISNLITIEFHRLIEGKWKDIDTIEKIDLSSSFEYCVAKITRGKGYYKIYNYFYIYESIFNLIKNENLSPRDEEYFKDLVRNSMEVGEQVIILWIASFSDYYQNFLMDSGVFSFELPDSHIPFIRKFLSTTLFFNQEFVNRINEYSNDNPLA